MVELPRYMPKTRASLLTTLVNFKLVTKTYLYFSVYHYSYGQLGRQGVPYGAFAGERRRRHGCGHGGVADAHRAAETACLQNGQPMWQRLYKRHVPGEGHKNHVSPVARPPGIQEAQAQAYQARPGNGHHRAGTVKFMYHDSVLNINILILLRKFHISLTIFFFFFILI